MMCWKGGVYRMKNIDNTEEDILKEFKKSEYYNFLNNEKKCGYYIDRISKLTNPKIKMRARNLFKIVGYNENIERNCANIKKFYESDFYRYLLRRDQDTLIKNVIFQALYIDPDSQIRDNIPVNVFNNNGIVVGKKEIVLSGDAILSAKKIYKYSKVNEAIDWVYEYKKYRNEKYAILKWPRHKVPTINTQRQICFNDKIDYTLFDIKCFYSLKNEMKLKDEKNFRNAVVKTCKMGKALVNADTYIWLSGFPDFKSFIDDQKGLKIFVQENEKNKDYDVVDIESKKGEVLSCNNAKVYTAEWSEDYYKNLKHILEKSIL